jgi:hypothetical protein
MLKLFARRSSRGERKACSCRAWRSASFAVRAFRGAHVTLEAAMAHYDVFNGDADGICSLHQLRLEEPRDATLVTGVKRDIALLARVPAQKGDSVTALDISAATNRQALDELLERGVPVQYFDHHFAGDLPRHPGLRALIDTSPGVCTGILVDRFLEGRRRIWAVVAAFGDNLDAGARDLAEPLELDEEQLGTLRALGENLAYNAYGESESDLVAPPAALYRTVSRYADPFRLFDEEPLLERIDTARRGDLARAAALQPDYRLERAIVYVLPDEAWSRRVRGVFGNELANRFPDLAHAILTRDAVGDYVVSVRAPRASPTGADTLCRGFATGGGRAAAAGINHLPRDELPEFVRCLDQAFG